MPDARQALRDGLGPRLSRAWLASRTLAAADGRTLSDLIEHLLADYVASKRKAYLELLRTDARRVDQLPGWASRAFLRLRHADELEGASRMLGEWAREIEGEGEGEC